MIKENILVGIFLHDAFYVGVKQIIPRLILHTIFNEYPHNNLINKGMSIVQNLNVWCDLSWYIWYGINVVVTHNNTFDSLSTAVDEVYRHIYFIPDNIIVFCTKVYTICCDFC